jgi:hypothetical protein
LWKEYLLPYEDEASTLKCVSDWDRLHFRRDSDVDGAGGGRRMTPEVETTPRDKIAKRLRSYDRPRPPPELTLTAPSVEQLADATFASVQNVTAVAKPLIETLNEYAR